MASKSDKYREMMGQFQEEKQNRTPSAGRPAPATGGSKADRYRQLMGQWENEKTVREKSAQQTVTGGVLGAVPGAKMVSMFPEYPELLKQRDDQQTRLEQLRKAQEDLYTLEGPYGYLANDTVSPEKRAEYQARYDEILNQYGKDATSDSLREQMEQLEGELNANRDRITESKNWTQISGLSEQELDTLYRYSTARNTPFEVVNGQVRLPSAMIQTDTDVRALFDKYGKETVDKLAETLGRDVNRTAASYMQEEGQKIGESLGFGAIPLGVGSGMLSAVSNPIGILHSRVTDTGQYSTADPYNPGSMFSYLSQGIGAGGAKKAPEQIVNRHIYEATRGTKAGEVIDAVGEGAYLIVNTAADSLARAYMGGGLFGAGTTGAKALSLGLAGARSFGDTFNDVSAKGGTPTQAAVLGVFNAGTEIATEYIPLEEWWKVAENGSDSVKAMLKAAAKQGAMEMTQEEIGFLATTMAEYAVLREKSEFQVLKKDLIDSGMTEEQAERAIWEEFGKQAAGVAVTSFFSGALSEAGAEAYRSLMPGTIANEDAAPAGLPYAGEPSPLSQPDRLTALPGGEPMPSSTASGPPSPEGRYGDVSEAGTVPKAETPLAKAQDYYRQNGTISNSMAEAILADNEALTELTRLTPVKLDGTKSQNRAEIRAAVARISGEAELSPEGQVQAMADAVGDAELRQTEQAAPEQERLWSNDASENGWGELTSNSVWATALAVKEVNPELFAVYESSAEAGKLSPVIDAVIAASQDVRQETISPMAAATILDEAYRADGERGLLRLFNSRNGNLYDEALDRMKAVAAPKTVAGDVTGAVAAAMRGEAYAAAEGTTPQRAKAEDTPPVSYAGSPLREGAGDAAQEQNAGLEEAEGRMPAMGAADRGFSPKYAAIEQYGAIPEGENPVRADQLPASITGFDRVSYSARTAMEAQATPDEFVPLIENETMRGGFSFIPITNSDTVQEAVDTITAEGWNTARANWTAEVRRGRAGADITAMGALLYNNAVNRGDYQEAMDILLDYSMAVRNSAQALQAARILKTLAPSDRLYCIRRSVQRMVDDMGTNRQITINEDLARQYQEAQTDEEADEILDEIIRDVARQLPPSWAERLTALRYLNMLGNFRTQVRNIMGNIGAQVTYLAKDEVKATIEWLTSAVSGGRYQRSTVHIADRQTMAAARDDYDTVADIISNGGRYNDRIGEQADFARRVQEERRILPPGLEHYRRATNWAMDNRFFGDAAFGRAAYSRALAGYLNARGIRTNDLSTVDQTLLDQAREYAIRQAQEATFRDNNALSGFVSRALRGRDTPAWARVIGEAVVPFRRTPANVLVRAEEFSPLGLINSTINSVRAAQGQITGTELVESWAKTLTGTGLFAIGWMLANMGILRGGPDDDEDEAALDELTGHQDYAIMLPGGLNFTIDFFSPAAIPMFLGAQMDAILEDGDLTWSDLDKVFLALADPMIEMSMLQGINDTIDSIRYADSSMGQFLVNAAVSYLTQMLGNTLMGQIERSTEKNRMTTYIDKDSPVPAWLQRNLGKLSQKIPVWDFQQTEYRNEWGETEENPDGILNAIYQLFSPAYFNRAEVSELEEEIRRLNKAQDDVSVVPKKAADTLTYTGKDGVKHENYQLTREEYDTLQRVQGETAKKLLEEVVGSDAYAAMNDRQKAAIFESVYDYAREAARDEAIADYAPEYSGWMDDLRENGIGALFARTAQQDISGAFDDLSETGYTGAAAQDAIGQMEAALDIYEGLSDEQKAAFLEGNSGRVASLIRATESGMSAATFAELYGHYKDIEGNSLMSKKDQANAWGAYLYNQQKRGKITPAQVAQLREDIKIWQQIPMDPAKLDAMVEAGLGTDAAMDTIDLIAGLEPKEGNAEVTPAQKWAAIVGSDMTDAEMDIAIKAYMTDFNPDAKTPDRTELKYDAIRDMGFSPEQFVAMYEAYSNTKGKWMKIGALDAMPGVSNREAELLYSIYSGDYFKKK